jgi:tetratricopeptide (TPR) repeat protein
VTAVRDVIAELEDRLARYPADRYPVQHATAQFHLGIALTNADRLDEAEAALSTAVRLFDPERLRVEQAKALNALGAVLRLSGRLGEAARALERAALQLGPGHALERGAALFNLGLVRRELGDSDAAVSCFRQARELLDARRVPTQAAAAARELGATLFGAGDLDTAARTLAEAVTLAARAGHAAEVGAATNTLGLVQLAAGNTAEAVEQFRRSAASHPRGRRPHEYAMAKANLALAYDRAGDEPRARLAARQALGAPDTPPPVAAQAAEILARLGRGEDDLHLVLEQESREAWPALVREELARLADAGPDERSGDLGAWIDGQLARPPVAEDLAEALLGGFLELPPEAMELLVRSTLEALGDRDAERRERFRAEASRALARFHTPQLVRLKDTFARLAADLGHEEWT